MCVHDLEWFDSFFLLSLFFVTFSCSNLSGNENPAHLTKGNKFALDRHEGAAGHIDGKGRVVIFPFLGSVTFFHLPEH